MYSPVVNHMNIIILTIIFHYSFFFFIVVEWIEEVVDRYYNYFFNPMGTQKKYFPFMWNQFFIVIINQETLFVHYYVGAKIKTKEAQSHDSPLKYGYVCNIIKKKIKPLLICLYQRAQSQAVIQKMFMIFFFFLVEQL